MKFKTKHLFWMLSLLVAFGFDQLFWEKRGGINFFIFVVFALLGGLIPIWLEKIHIPFTSYLLLIPVLFFSVMSFIHAEPFTRVINVGLTLGLLILFAMTLRNGRWFKFRLSDHLERFGHFLLNGITGGASFFRYLKKETTQTPENLDELSDPTPQPAKQNWWKKSAPYLRGFLIALPILLVLALLLAAADPVFENRLGSILDWFKLENLSENFFRLIYILVLAYLLLSVYFFGLAKSEKSPKENGKGSNIKPFLGSIESNIVLIAVNVLFALFVILQFRYLFGGQANISVEGFTYAEYARRGFFELLAVALISLLLFYILSMITRRESKAKRWTFSGLGLLLVLLVGVILASSYTRLGLYESAYGFTRLRTLTHIFIIWTALLLVAVAALEITKHMHRLAFVLILWLISFGLTVNLVNVDAFIVKQNIKRAAIDGTISEPLDTGYLLALSADAVPNLLDEYNNSDLAHTLHNEIGSVLACWLAAEETNQQMPWPSYHYARSSAIKLLSSHENLLEKYPVTYYENELVEIKDGSFILFGPYVEVNGELRSCYGSSPYSPDLID